MVVALSINHLHAFPGQVCRRVSRAAKIARGATCRRRRLDAYGIVIGDLYRRRCLDKILKGAKPADVPVVQPMNFAILKYIETIAGR